MSEEQFVHFLNTCFVCLGEAKKLLNADPSLINKKNGIGETALHYLAVENQLEAVKFLHNNGADLNTNNNFGDSALAEASSLGYIDLVKYLLENGANIDQQKGSADPILFEAINSGNPEMLDLLVKFGADLNARNFLNDTLLHESASDDEWLEVTKYFLSKGADINAVNGFNSPPISAAIVQDAVDSARHLAEQGADLTIKDSKGRSPIQLAEDFNLEALTSFFQSIEERNTP